jgi:hypothetical protein
MGSTTEVGTPLLGPPTPATAATDKAVAPREWHPDLYDSLVGMKTNTTAPTENWTAWEDCNSSDMDLCEWKGQTLMMFNWGCQHSTEALALALSPVPLDGFLRGWFSKEKDSKTE